MKVSTREKNFLIVGGLAAAAILAGVYVVEPLATSQIKVREEIRQKQGLLERHLLLASEEERYRKKVEALRARAQLARESHFHEEKFPLVAAEIQGLLHRLGQEAGITIVRENVPPPKKSGVFTPVTVELSVRGELGTLRDFLYKIQTASKLLTIPRLIIRGVPSRGQTGLSADMQVDGYMAGGEEGAK